MHPSPSLFSEVPGETVAEPHLGPGWVRSRFTRGFFLTVALLGAAGALALPRLAQRGHCGCQARRAVQAPPPAAPRLGAADLEELDDHLTQELRDYEQAMQEGRGCHMGWVKLRLAQLHVREQRTLCGRGRARIRDEIARLTRWQSELQARAVPQGHPSIASDL